tara:strand:+ start:729 stop:911 length:183 start_codon:yes stop_codon:yes gene_type:complete
MLHSLDFIHPNDLTLPNVEGTCLVKDFFELLKHMDKNLTLLFSGDLFAAKRRKGRPVEGR